MKVLVAGPLKFPVWKSRFAAPAPDARERARQARFLQGRGFPLEDVLRFLRSVEKPG